jgi:nitric oxide reductase subunit C
MSASFTTSTARNIFYGGTVFFFLLFLALTYQNEQALPARDNRANLTPQVVAGKKIWETRNCVGCHTLLGEGAYFAPELGNVYVPAAARKAARSSSRHGFRRSPRAHLAVARCRSSI